MAASDSFRVPPEEAPHQLTFMQWPLSPEVYGRGGYRRAVQGVIAEIANTVAQFEPVVMLAAPETHADARKHLAANVALWEIPADDLWCRDSGPLFARDNAGRLSVRHVNFNGWGRYHHPDDERIEAPRYGAPPPPPDAIDPVPDERPAARKYGAPPAPEESPLK